MRSTFRSGVSASYRCRRCLQLDFEQMILNIEINRSAWARVLNTVIPLAQQNALSVEVLTKLRNALRNDLLKLRTKRKHVQLIESKPAGIVWIRVGYLYVDENSKRSLRIVFDTIISSTLDLAIAPYRGLGKAPILRCARMKRAKSV